MAAFLHTTEAWVEQIQSDHSPSSSPSPGHTPESLEQTQPFSPSIVLTRPGINTLSLDELYGRQLDTSPDTPRLTDREELDANLDSPQLEDEDKFFLTEGKIRKSSKEDSDYPDSAKHQVMKLSELGML